MAFKESLKFAVELKGEATAFKQEDNVCLAHSMRWMIDQLIGRKFSKSYPTQDVTWHLKIKQVVDDEQRRKKAKKLYDKLEYVQNRDDTGSRPTGVATRYQLNKKFKGDIRVEEPVEDPNMVGGVLAIKRLATRGNDQVAAMISLRTTAEGGKGAGIPTFNHALAFYSRNEKVRFFYPNMGEVKVTSETFGKWFDKYHSEWATHRQMMHVNSAVVFEVHAPPDVKAFVREEKQNILDGMFNELKSEITDFQQPETLVFHAVNKMSARQQDVLNTPTDLYSEFEDFKLDW